MTEYVSGEDLVEHMLWVGAGEPLPARLTEVGLRYFFWGGRGTSWCVLCVCGVFFLVLIRCA